MLMEEELPDPLHEVQLQLRSWKMNLQQKKRKKYQPLKVIVDKIHSVSQKLKFI